MTADIKCNLFGSGLLPLMGGLPAEPHQLKTLVSVLQEELESPHSAHVPGEGRPAAQQQARRELPLPSSGEGRTQLRTRSLPRLSPWGVE